MRWSNSKGEPVVMPEAGYRVTLVGGTVVEIPPERRVKTPFGWGFLAGPYRDKPQEAVAAAHPEPARRWWPVSWPWGERVTPPEGITRGHTGSRSDSCIVRYWAHDSLCPTSDAVVSEGCVWVTPETLEWPGDGLEKS